MEPQPRLNAIFKKNCFLTDLLLLACLNFELCLEIDEIFHLQYTPLKMMTNEIKESYFRTHYV